MAAFPRLSFPSTHVGSEEPPARAGQGVCLTPPFTLSGFDYPRSVLVPPKPTSHISGSSVRGISPSESFSRRRAAPLSKRFTLMSLQADFRVLLTSPSRAHHCNCYVALVADTLLGFRISEVFSAPTRFTTSDEFLFCAFRHPRITRMTRHSRDFLSSRRLNPCGLSYLSDVSRLIAVPQLLDETPNAGLSYSPNFPPTHYCTDGKFLAFEMLHRLSANREKRLGLTS